MSHANRKQQAHALIDKFPDDATWDDIVYEMVVRREIEFGLTDSEADSVQDARALRAEHRQAD